jgi:hypothetical protein
MIVLRGYRVLESPTGKKRLLFGKIFKKWPNNHDFGFNIFKMKNWMRFLSKDYRSDKNKLLLKKTKDGEPIAYEVYYWGVPKYAKQHFEHLPLKNNNGYLCLFPGYDKEGKKRDIAVYGVLQNYEFNQK